MPARSIRYINFFVCAHAAGSCGCMLISVKQNALC